MSTRRRAAPSFEKTAPEFRWVTGRNRTGIHRLRARCSTIELRSPNGPVSNEAGPFHFWIRCQHRASANHNNLWIAPDSHPHVVTGLRLETDQIQVAAEARTAPETSAPIASAAPQTGAQSGKSQRAAIAGCRYMRRLPRAPFNASAVRAVSS